MKKIFNILDKIFTAYIGICMLFCTLVCGIEIYGLITNNPKASERVLTTYTIGLLASWTFFQDREIKKLKKKIDND